MKNHYTKSVVVLAAFLFTIFGFSQNYTNGVFILNEGLIGTETAEVSFLDANGILENNIFSTQNAGVPLGDTGQGMGLTEDFAYIILNYSNEIKVVNRTNFELVTSITDQIEMPRHIAFHQGKGYVTNWGDPSDTTDDYIAVIDLVTNTVTGTIPVAEGPEIIIEKNGILYIAHLGGYGYGNTVSVIETITQNLTTLEVADLPSALKIDNEKLYVLCSGKPDWTGDETIGGLYIFDLIDFQNVEVYPFGVMEHPEFLGLDTTDLYYVLNSDIYKMELGGNTLPVSPFIETSSNNVQIPYGFNKIDDKLYLADAVDYVSEGKVYVYGEDGSFKTEFTVGPLPNSFYKFEEETASTPDFASAIISVYPNPTSENFYLNTSETAIIDIYDLTGRLVKTAKYNSTAVSVAGLKSGVYLLQIEVEGKTTIQKLIVE